MVLTSVIYVTLMIASHVSFSRESVIPSEECNSVVCQQSVSRESVIPSEECNTVVCQQSARYISDAMDTSIDPCQDFYRYSCGGWIEKHPIPGDKSLLREFDVLNDEVTRRVANMLKTAINEVHPRAVYDAANLFLGCTDEDAREAEGLQPLKNILNGIGGWPITDHRWSSPEYRWEDIESLTTRLIGMSSIIAVSVGIDDQNTSQHIITLTQPSFFLDRDQLNFTSPEQFQARAYRDYIVSTAKLLKPNIEVALVAKDAEEMMHFESALVRLTRSKEEKRDPRSSYHKMTVSEVKALTEDTNFDWSVFLDRVFHGLAVITDETEVIVAEIDYIVNAIKLVEETNPRVLANYLGWNVLKKLGQHTTKKFRENQFELTRLLTGVQEDEKLENTCMTETTKLLEFAVGRLYVDKYFPEDKKRNVEQMIEDIRSAYRFTLMENTWMDEYTRSKTLEKLDAMAVQVGYPSWLKSDRKLNKFYSGFLPVRRDKYFKYHLQITSVLTERHLSFVNKRIADVRELYWAAPTDVNAYYHPQLNTIHFPAGILDKPMYRYGTPSALNFGSLGSVIGHEIGHGFDDQGSQYDAQGNLVNWWSEETKVHFEKKADCFRDQYSNYVEPLTNLRVDENNTIGENIGDNGGIRNAYIAYRIHQTNSIRNEGHGDKRLPGISANSDQLFFLGYSTMYCEVARKAAMEYLLSTDTHSPGEIRVLGGLSNSREFAEAFNCPSSSRMNPESKCILW